VPPSLRIGLVGDRRDAVRAHGAIPRALELVAGATRYETVWLPTDAMGDDAALASFDAFWCVPGSPYRDMNGALRAIRFAREHSRPFLGTCGGFQHAVIEYARAVLGLETADHAESNPDAAFLLVTPLACSLAGEKRPIVLTPGSRLADIYGATRAVEAYQCRYGLARAAAARFAETALHITALDEDGEPRGVELGGHPFFVATLFQPELSALDGVPHPLVGAFFRAASSASTRLREGTSVQSGMCP
jgi:CTP synthase (UTP-ammonia lyase)